GSGQGPAVADPAQAGGPKAKGLEIASNRHDPVARAYLCAAPREQPVLKESPPRDPDESRPGTAAGHDGVGRATRDVSCCAFEKSRVEPVERGWCERTRAGRDSLRRCRSKEVGDLRQSRGRGDDECRKDGG